MNELTALYYPFSRCVKPTSLKQLLMVFDRISFVDPLDDDEWRSKLFSNLEAYDRRFSSYHGIDSALPDLLDHGCILRKDPAEFVSRERVLATASAISDLQDAKWLSVASKPQRFKLPSILLSGAPSWQTFLPKLPATFIEALSSHPTLRPHLLEEGDEWSSWSLSYAAGSAIATALHLEIAEELGDAPVTDSELHHRLLLMKFSRGSGSTDKPKPVEDNVLRSLTSDIAMTMLSEVMPEEKLNEVSFDDIILFRADTSILRKHFISDIEARLSVLKVTPDPEECLLAARQVSADLRKELRQYQAEFAFSREKVWPGMVDATRTAAITSGTLVAVAMSYIGSPGKALVGTIAAASIAMIKTALDLKAERRKLVNSAAPALAYLSRVSAYR